MLLTNIKIAKNGQYHDNDIEKLKKDVAKEATLSLDKPRRSLNVINISRDAVMKVKTSSGIKRFQGDKKLGS